MQSLKRTLTHNLALTILGKPRFERILCLLCANPFTRKSLKVGAIAFACLGALEEPELRIANLGTYKLWVNISEFLGTSLYFFGEHNEPFSAQLVSELIHPGDTCIDIGANQGSYTFLMASLVGKNGKVVAFEPQLDLGQMLKDSLLLNDYGDRLLLDGRAVYKNSGEKLKFYLSEDIKNSGHSSLVNHGVHVSAERVAIVETITLTDFFQEQNIDFAKVVKIDVERAELEVIQGATDLFKQQRIKSVILEQEAGSDAQKLLESHQYQCWMIDEMRNKLVNIKSVKKGQFANYLFVSPNLNNAFNQRYQSCIENA
ncbi:MAG: FkbM family methyltransferase [Desertifilum sp.]|nr:FkbM family methyltransferase [Desertifilum sp.]